MKKISTLLLCFCISLLALTSTTLYSTTTLAYRNKPNWTTGDPIYRQGDSLATQPKCSKEDITITSLPYHVYVENEPLYELTFNGTVHKDICVYHARDYSYVRYIRFYYADPTSPASGTFSESGVAVLFGKEDSFHAVAGLEMDDRVFLGNTTNSYIAYGPNDRNFKFYNDLRGSITRRDDGTLVLSGSPDYTYTDATGSAVNVDGLGASSNKRWVTFGVRNFGIILFDVTTQSANRVSDRYDIQSWTWPTPMLDTTVNDDGSYVVVGGMGYQTEVIMVSQCGSSSLANGFSYRSQLLGLNACQYRDVTSLTWDNSQPTGGNGLRALNQLHMSASGDRFSYWDNYQWSTIYAPNYLLPGQLYYLAIGDSYASGEGDVTLDGVDHYLFGTNVYGNYKIGIPRETCHVSTRAYPLLIAQEMLLTRGADMQSIACSGAIMGDVLSPKFKNDGYVDTAYLGQPTQHVASSSPRLAGISNSAQLQADARLNYIPGRVQQLELVKKAQPLYATIMMSGNDLGFGDFLTTCAVNTLPGDDGTCDYAYGEGLMGQAQKIHDLYPKLVEFYKDIEEVSPRTKIFVIGYPQFMDENSQSCPEMLNLYTRPERRAIHSLIAYANGVIRNAALDAGVKYIDVSGALIGKQLCGSGTGMTGATDLLATMIYTEYMKSITMADSNIAKYANVLPTGELHTTALKMYVAERAVSLLDDILYSPATALADLGQELSHPNAIGHKAIFDVIKDGLGEDMLDSTLCNQIVSCPSNVILGQPDVTSYMSGLSLKNDTVYIRGRGKITVGHKDPSGKITVGALVMSLAEQFIRITLGAVDGTVDPSRPVTVEIHSQPVMLGEMTRVDDAYELVTSLSEDVSLGQHVLHIKGTMMDGRLFDVDSPVFVEGPRGDIDNDGISDQEDGCAFGASSGLDGDRDGIDDVCDLNTTPLRSATSASSPKTRDIKVKDLGRIDMQAGTMQDEPLVDSRGSDVGLAGVKPMRAQITNSNNLSNYERWSMWTMFLAASMVGAGLTIAIVAYRTLHVK